VTGCLRPTPVDYLSNPTGIQPAEFRYNGATLYEVPRVTSPRVTSQHLDFTKSWHYASHSWGSSLASTGALEQPRTAALALVNLKAECCTPSDTWKNCPTLLRGKWARSKI